MSSAHNAETVKVIVRCRPMNEKEVSENYERYYNIIGHLLILTVICLVSEQACKCSTKTRCYRNSNTHQTAHF